MRGFLFSSCFSTRCLTGGERTGFPCWVLPCGEKELGSHPGWGRDRWGPRLTLFEPVADVASEQPWPVCGLRIKAGA